MNFWFYIAAAEYVIVCGFIHGMMRDKEWPTDPSMQVGAYVSLALWPICFLYVLGDFLWRVSRKLVSSLRSGKQ